MAMNRVQFQKGLSVVNFLDKYGTEDKCEAVLEATRWPNGFICPRCGHSGHCIVLSIMTNAKPTNVIVAVHKQH
jgi:hypothetical protein